MKGQNTIKDVAREAHVAISTVSRVLNNSGYVSEETRRKVLQTVKQLSYQQNNIARNLRQKNSNFIGLVVPDISNEFYSSLSKVIERELHKAKFHLFLGSTEENETVENDIVDSMINNQVNGLIIIGSGEKINPRILNENIPTVFFDKNIDHQMPRNIVFVKSDNYLGARIATETLLNKGCRRIAMIRTFHPSVPMEEREKAFIDTARSYNLIRKSYKVYSVPISFQAALRKTEEIFASERFDGIFCAADILAIGVIKALQNMNLRIPEDVQVIGFDDIPLATFITPTLSTIHSDFEAIGCTIASNIIKLSNKQETERVTILPIRYIERESTKV